MCLGTFSRRGAVASATIYLCAECASLRSAFLFHRTQFPMKQKRARPTCDRTLMESFVSFKNLCQLCEVLNGANHLAGVRVLVVVP